MKRKKFSGVLPPILTPLKDAATVDVAALKRHAGNLIDAGRAGIFVAGSMGEGPNLTQRAWRQAVDAVLDAASGRVPVYVGAIEVSSNAPPRSSGSLTAPAPQRRSLRLRSTSGTRAPRWSNTSDASQMPRRWTWCCITSHP